MKKVHLKLSYGIGVCGFHAPEERLTHALSEVTCRVCYNEGKIQHAYQPIGTGECWKCGKAVHQHQGGKA